MRARGFTLIEILLVLALFVMILSLVGPALMGRIAPMTFERSAEQIESALLTAREDSRRTGAVLFVYAERDESDGLTRLVSRREPTGGAAEMEPMFNGESGGGFGGAEFEADRGDHLITLPARCRLTHEAPGFGAEGSGMPAGFLEDPPSGPSGPSGPPGSAGSADGLGFEASSFFTPILLMVCLPDGSLALPRPVWLVDGGSRAAEIRVDGAVGVVRVVEVGPARLDGEPRGRDFPEPIGAVSEGVVSEAGP